MVLSEIICVYINDMLSGLHDSLLVHCPRKYTTQINTREESGNI